MNKDVRFLISLFLVVLSIPQVIHADENMQRILTLEEYLQKATHNDTEFQEILIDELTLQYRKDLNLPAKDVVLAVTSKYDLYLSQDREEQEGSVSLSKLFPRTGTEIEANYSTSPGVTRTTNSSDIGIAITQPIAENAFGKVTRLRDKIIGVEIDVAQHQIIEAYEDYFATLITAYFEWYEAYENLKISESSYEENLKLMDNIKERQKSSIALPVDVNKISLQVLAKKETLIDLREKYHNKLNFIKQVTRHQGSETLLPQKPHQYTTLELDFEKEYQSFKDDSRTYTILNLLEKKSSLEVDRYANELLPSIDMLIGYDVTGSDLEIKDEDNKFYAGFTMEWPIGNQVEKAQYDTSVINQRKTEYSTTNTHYRLYTNIKNLALQMDREKQLLEIAFEKINLAQSVLEDETENYSYGKVTINDYIQAVNTLDNNRFNKIRHESLKAKLIVEWLRMTDRLVQRNDIPVYPK